MNPNEIRAVAEAALAEAGWPELEARGGAPSTRLRDRITRLEARCDAGEQRAAARDLGALLSALFTPVAGASSSGPPVASQPASTVERTPTELLELLAPSPRVLSAPLAAVVADPATALASLHAPDPLTRVVALRALEAKDTPDTIAALANLVASDPEVYVRLEALAVARSSSEKVRAKLGRALTRHTRADAADVRTSALRAMRLLGFELDDKPLARGLADHDPAVRAEAARSVTTGLSEANESALIALLSERNGGVQDAALVGVRSAKLTTSGRQPDVMIKALAAIARGSNPDRVALSIYLLWNYGPQAAEVTLDVVRALAVTAEPEQAIKTLDAFAATPAEAVPLLEAHLVGPRSDTAHAAAQILETQYGRPTEVPLATQLERIAVEVQSDDPRARRSGAIAALRLGGAASSLIPVLKAAGNEIATAAIDDADVGAELQRIRDTLLALGCPEDERPRVPSDLDGYRGNSPRERARFDGYVIADVGDRGTDDRSDRAGRTAPSLGIWEAGSGRLLFVVEGAEALAARPGTPEVALVRSDTVTEQADAVAERRYFERYALPGGERVSSVELEPRGRCLSITLTERNGTQTAKIRFDELGGGKPIWLELGEDADTVVLSPAKRKRGRKKTGASAKRNG